MQKTDEASRIAKLFMKEIVRLHGLPTSIVSDRDPKFVGQFWKNLWKRLNTTLKFSTTTHPQTDDLTEVVNQSVGSLLKALVDQNPGGWEKVLSMAEFAYNALINRTTGKSPFEIVYGVIPKQVTDLIECDHLIQGVEDLLGNIQTVQEKAGTRSNRIQHQQIQRRN